MAYFTYDNHRLFYREQGKGPLLLILPGNTASSACLQGELEYFGERFQAVSFDFMGTGQSDRLAFWPEDWWKQGADQATALIEHLGRDRCVVMGSSGGAVIALLMAIFHPKQVDAVIADSCVEKFPAESLRDEVSRRSQAPEELLDFWKFAHGDDWQQVVDADSNLMLRFAEQESDCFYGRLKEIVCPVLLTASLQDTDLPNVGDQIVTMAEQIPDSRIFMMKKGAHPLMWTCPEDFREVSNYFLSQIRRPIK